MTRTRNVRNITKFKRSINAISPVIATLLMIAIAVVASLVVYAWVSGYLGFQTTKAGKAIQIPSFALNTDKDMIIYVQNVGQGTVQVGTVYIDDQQVADFSTDASKQIGEGNTVELQITDKDYDPNTRYDLKVTTTDGTSMTATGKPGSGGSGGAPPHGDATSISITPETTSVPAGGTATFTATASDGTTTWDVSSLTTWSITAGAGGSWASNVYTSANSGDWTVTGQYSGFSDTAALHVDTGSVDHVTVSPDTAEIDAGDPQTFTLMAYDTVGNSWDVSTSATWGADAGASGSWAANVYTSENDGTWTVTGTYSGKSDTAQLTVNQAAQPQTLLNDGFENQGKWQTTNWFISTDQYQSGSHSIKSSSSSEGYLASTNINALGGSSMTITFYYRVDDTEDNDFWLYFFDGSNWDFKVDLGQGNEDTWGSPSPYTTTISNSGGDAQYFKSNFQIRFWTDIESGGGGDENVWVDNVQITVVGGPGTTFSDDFENVDTNWNSNWVGNWITDDNPVHSGSISARSDGTFGGNFKTVDLDASDATSITIDFWYYLTGTDNEDFWVYAYDGTNYDLLSNLGDDTPQNTWLHFTQTLTDNQYFDSTFNIQFNTQIGGGKVVYVDDVVITKLV